MRNLVALTVIMFFSLTIYCQKVEKLEYQQVPTQIIDQFNKNFADIKTAKWTKCDTKYEAIFEKEEMKTVVLYNNTGYWEQTKWEMPVKYSPQAINEYIKNKFSDYKVKTLYLSDSPTGRYYIINLEKKKEKVELYFGLDYSFVKQLPEPKKEATSPANQEKNIQNAPTAPVIKDTPNTQNAPTSPVSPKPAPTENPK